MARIITRLNIGGPAVQALLLTERLDPDRFETLLICGRPGAREGDMSRLRSSDVRAVSISALGREISPLADVVTLVRLVRVLAGFRPDVVHTHLAKAGLLGRLAARIVGTRIVIHTFHGNVLRGYFGATRSWLFLQIERALARLSTRVIAISPRQSAELRSLGIGASDRIVEVPLGLDLAPLLDAPTGRLRSELRIRGETPLVGIVARLVPVKAVDVFLRAAALLASSRPDVRFVIVGDGELRDELERLADDLRIAGRITFLGWRADLPGIYADLDVVVLTSNNEGTPVSIIESLAAGRAVVATSVGGVPDIVAHGETGVLVRPGDPVVVADAIAELLSDPERRARLGAAGRSRVYPAYDAATLIRRIDDLYTGLVATIR